jgi:hypothetical protein
MTGVTNFAHWMEPHQGLSERIKHYADSIPEHQASHWILLLVSDRVDEMESQVVDTLKNPWVLLSMALSVGAAVYFRRTPSLA